MSKQETKIPEIFNFDKNEIERVIQYELKVMSRLENSFDFVYDKLVKAKQHRNVSYAKKVNLNSIKKNEGKNYDWLAITCGNVQLIIRTYGTHFTIYCKLSEKRQLTSSRKYTNVKYGAFIFHVNQDKMDVETLEHIQDRCYDEPFNELNKVFMNMIKKIKEGHMQSLWNSVGFVRPDYCDVNIIYYSESIYSIDKLVFCCEEMSNMHVSLFAENEMLEKLKTIGHRVGEKFDYRSTITEIKTEFPEQYSDPYYHGVGIKTIDDRDYERIHDVYCLTQYHLDFVFK